MRLQQTSIPMPKIPRINFIREGKNLFWVCAMAIYVTTKEWSYHGYSPMPNGRVVWEVVITEVGR